MPMAALTSFIDAVNRGDLATVTDMVAREPALARDTDADGATALHHAAFTAQHDVVDALLQAGADLNARDGTFDATPGGWALHRLRERGALLAIEIDDVVYALERGEVAWVQRFVTRHPALATACDRQGRPLSDYPGVQSTPELADLFATARGEEPA